MRWTVYCRVIDNFGDIGVAWRLAADLAARGEAVRLVVDDASALAWLAPDPAGSGVEVSAWQGSAGVAPEVAVETFGCGLPAGVAEAWLAARTSPLHVNVEHLSAEPYAARSHGLALATTAARPLPARLYYPGFVPESGGLLREPGLLARRAAFRADPGRERQVSLFCYEADFVPALLDALPEGEVRVVCAPGAATAAALAWQRERAAIDHATGRPHHLRIVAAPYVAQPGFDERLWASELNVVRGEDSLVRAIWAGRPFVWQLYRQADGAHLHKLEAFLDCFLAAADAGLAASLRQLFRRCNGGTGKVSLPAFEAWRTHCTGFAARLAEQHDLTTRLLAFFPR